MDCPKCDNELEVNEWDGVSQYCPECDIHFANENGVLTEIVIKRIATLYERPGYKRDKRELR